MRELLAQTVRDTDPRCRDYGIVRALHPQHEDLVRVEWLTGAWAGHVTDWTAAELEPLGFGVRPPEPVCEDCESAPQIAGSAFCRTCDAWNNRCVAQVVEGRYSNGSLMFTVRCKFCGWEASGSFGSRATATAIAAPHTKAPVNV